MIRKLQLVLFRKRVELRDTLAYGAAGRGARIIMAWCASVLSVSTRDRIVRRAALVRLLSGGALRRRIVARLRGAIDREPAAVILAHSTRPTTLAVRGTLATRTTVLKAPAGGGERGVIYSLFENNWSRILEGIGDLRDLLRDYDVVWVTAWSPTDYLALARILASSAADNPMYIEASTVEEMEPLAAFHPRIRVIPHLPCEYLDPTAFESLRYDLRDVDLLVVANWAPFKRHFELFRALRRLPADLRVICVGQPEKGHTQAEIRQLAAAYGVPQELEFRDSIPYAEVRELQARSKAAAIFSRREGHCVSAVQALFAGASLGLMAGAHVGPVAYVNPETGVPLRRGHMVEDLRQLIAGAPGRTPRDWALAHLGSDRATQRLNQWLKDRAAERGLPWTSGIATLAWSPYPWVADATARAALQPAVLELHRRFPALFAPDLLDVSRN